MRPTFALFRLLSVLAALAADLAAQAPDPPAELARFGAALGNWEGKGVARMAADGPELPWTSVSTTKKVFDGFAVREDVRVDLGPDAPAPLVFRTFYGWDAHRKSYIYFGVSNVGYAGRGEVHFTEGKLFSTRTYEEQGLLVTDRSVFQIEKDEARLRIDRSHAGAPFFTAVEGTYTRSGDGFDAASDDAGGALAPVPEEMGSLFGGFGSWRYKGEIRPVPGAEAMPISGTEKVRAILGGHAHASAVEGDPMPGAPRPYRGAFYLAWDPTARAYASAGVDNYEGLHFSTGYIAGERKMVFTASLVHAGTPMVSRTVVEWNEAGDRLEVRADRCAGTEPCDWVFRGIYERGGEAAGEKQDEKNPEKKTEL